MTRSHNFYPNGIYHFLSNLAFENKLSVKEVETILLRREIENLGFVCDHSNVNYSKTTHEPYCFDCWTRLVTIKPPTYFKGKIVKSGEYWPIETFLDKFYKEQSTRESKFEHEI